MRESKILSLDEAYEEKLQKARTPGAKDIRKRKRRHALLGIGEVITEMGREVLFRPDKRSHIPKGKKGVWIPKQKLEKSMIPVKGHMAGGHFVKPHFRKKFFKVTDAGGGKVYIEAYNKWDATQRAKNELKLTTVDAQEVFDYEIPSGKDVKFILMGEEGIKRLGEEKKK